MDRRKLNAIVGYVSRSLSAAALMIWGVFNISVLAIQFMRQSGEGGNWIASWLLCGLFGALPFLIGSWLLYRNISEVNQAPKKS